MQLAVQIRKREVGRFERREISILLRSPCAEIPDAVLCVRSERLFYESGEFSEVEPGRRSFLRDEFGLAVLRQWKTEFVATNALQLDHEPCRALEIVRRNPKFVR